MWRFQKHVGKRLCRVEDELVNKTIPDEQLPSVLSKRDEVWIVTTYDGPILRLGLCEQVPEMVRPILYKVCIEVQSAHF